MICFGFPQMGFPSAGVPESGSVQEVLIWQTCTVRMMYRIIAAALKESGSQNQPLDYLAFFCLGRHPPQP